MDATFRIHELATLVEQALAGGTPAEAASARVRDTPDVRTIRYYTTLGLLERPAEMRGRTAFYGLRHLRQLAAIKRMQRRSQPLVEIQRTLAGIDDVALQRLAELPAGFEESLPARLAALEDDRKPDREPVAETAPVAAPRTLFWASRPTANHPTSGASAPETVAASPGPALPGPGPGPLRPATVLPLGPGASLLLEHVDPRRLDAAAIESLRPATEALLAALAAAGLHPLSHVVSLPFDQETSR